ncbi:MAG: hypothetical protein KC766_30825, partial [Myxococcales bacterium]|nr:hypothetical protein [Myxococcales bacterium]
NMSDLTPNDPRLKSSLFVLVSGIRTAKSLMACARVIASTQTVDVTGLGPGEIPRIPLVSLSKDLAQVDMNHIVGVMEASPRLKKLLLPGGGKDALHVRHPSGRPIEIKVTAGSKAGGALVARWLGGGVFDEAPRMASSDEGLEVNLEHQVQAIRGRIRPGGVILLIGSAFAPRGMVYELVRAHHGRPEPHCVVLVADARWMNPMWWTPERAEELRVADYATYQTEVEAKFVDPEGNLFGGIIDPCTREEHLGVFLEPVPGLVYVATMDPATRRNAWTFAVWAKYPDGRIVQVAAKEWTGSPTQPLSPSFVMGEIKGICEMYGCDFVITDQKAFDELRDIAIGLGLALRENCWTAENKREMYTNAAARMAEGLVELAPLPEIKQDLLHVVRVVTPTTVRIELRKDGTGRHADWAPTVVLGVCEFLVYEAPPEPKREDEGFLAEEAALMERVMDDEDAMALYMDLV